MASFGSEQVISSKVSPAVASRGREEKLRLIKERQNEERQKKIEELKAQAESAQKYREQKEDERRRRIEELRNRDNDRRHQVEERKRAIMEAERERREYILRKNQEREARLDTKRRNERSSITFAFGSSTPRLLDPSELSNVSLSTFWGHRRSTSITNVAYTGTPLTRRSSERELAEGSKKRATSAGGIDKQNEDWRRKSTSLYEVFNWGFVNDEPPQRFPLSIAADIDIDGPPTTTSTNTVDISRETIKNVKKEETTDSLTINYRSVYRRKTDLMPTIPSPREPSFGSKSSLHSQAHTPRTQGRAISMTRLDQLAQPVRRNGEHIRAVIERERQQQKEQMILNNSPSSLNIINHLFPTTTIINFSKNKKNMSRSMIHVATTTNTANKSKQSSTHFGVAMRSLYKMDTTKSTTELVKSTILNRGTTIIAVTNIVTKKNEFQGSRINNEQDDVLLPSTTNLTCTGSRSGEITPRGSTNTSRPGSAMSTSTTASNLVQRRSTTSIRKPRPVSIAVTGVSQNEEQKQKREKPSISKLQSSSKRHSDSLKISNITDNKTIEKKLITKRDITPHKFSPSVTQSIEQKAMKDTTAKKEDIDEMKNYNLTTTDIPVPQTKEENDALNTVKPEINAASAMNSNGSVVIKEVQQIDVIDNIVRIVENKVVKASIKNQITEKNDDGSEKCITIIKEDRSRETSTEPHQHLQQQENEMTASMIARAKITTEEEAKAALAERRRLAREEAERQAALERQRLEEERQAELRRQRDEEERQRKFEEEALRLAERQRKAEEDRLLQAIEETKKRELEDRIKREEEEKLRAEKEESERKAKEEAEKQRLEVAERLKREEKEREERRKRVEAIMSRTRAKGGGNSTPNSTPVRESENKKEQNNINDKQSESVKISNEYLVKNSQDYKENNSEIIKVSDEQPQKQTKQLQQQTMPQQLQTTYEQSVTEKENALLKSSNNIIHDENVKNIQSVIQNPFLMTDVTNGKMSEPITQSQLMPQNMQTQQINETPIQQQLVLANGNSYVENNLNKNQTISLTGMSDQLIDISNESQQQQQQLENVVNFTNNNNLLTTTTTLVTADSHEKKEISLL